MIPLPSDARIWIALGHTDMRRGMRGLALQVQESLKRDPHQGDLYIFRGRCGSLVKILWHDDFGMSLRGGRVCLHSDRQWISGSSAGCFFELPIWDVTQGGRSPTGVMPYIGGQIHAAITIGRLSKYV